MMIQPRSIASLPAMLLFTFGQLTAQNDPDFLTQVNNFTNDGNAYSVKLSADGDYVAFVHDNGFNSYRLSIKSTAHVPSDTVLPGAATQIYDQNGSFDFGYCWRQNATGDVPQLMYGWNNPFAFTREVHLVSTSGSFLAAESFPLNAQQVSDAADGIRLPRQPVRDRFLGVGLRFQPGVLYYSLFVGRFNDGMQAQILETTTQNLVPFDIDPTEQWLLYARQIGGGSTPQWQLEKRNRLSGAIVVLTLPATTVNEIDAAFLGSHDRVVATYRAPSRQPTVAIANGTTFVDVGRTAAPVGGQQDFEQYEAVFAQPSHLLPTPSSNPGFTYVGRDLVGPYNNRDRLGRMPGFVGSTPGGGDEFLLRNFGSLGLDAPSIDRDSTLVALMFGNGTATLVDAPSQPTVTPTAASGTPLTIDFAATPGDPTNLWLSMGGGTTNLVGLIDPPIDLGFLGIDGDLILNTSGPGGTPPSLFLDLGPITTSYAFPAISSDPVFVGMDLNFQAVSLTKITRPTRIRVLQ